MSEPVEPGKIMPTYNGFIMLRINEIWSIWREGDPEEALKLALRLANTFLPRRLKKKVKHDADILTQAMNKIYKTQNTDFYNTQLIRNREAENMAKHYLGPFLGELSDVLDEWGCYEVPKRRVSHGKFEE